MHSYIYTKLQGNCYYYKIQGGGYFWEGHTGNIKGIGILFIWGISIYFILKLLLFFKLCHVCYNILLYV